MSHLPLDKWEKKYIVESIERFDQKNHMFSRPWWDPKMKDIHEKFYRQRIIPGEKAGWTLPDMAFGEGSWYLERTLSHGNIIGQHGPFAWEETTPQSASMLTTEGMKMDVTDPVKITRAIKKVATYFGADLVGICELDRRWVYSHSYNRTTLESKPLEIPEEYKYAISMAYEMDYELIKYAPTHIANGGTGMGYSKMAFTTGLLAKFIRSLGYKAIPCGNDTARGIPIAMQAGLGELGRNGLLITKEYGPRIRLSKIFTNLPLVTDQPIDFGVTEFCNKCQKCAITCPSQSIIYGERTTQPHNICNARNELKWPINAESCLKFWGTNRGSCIVCIMVCPFNKHMNWLHRLVRSGIEHVPWADSFLIKMDNILGYGKPAPAPDFWDKWKPRSGLKTNS